MEIAYRVHFDDNRATSHYGPAQPSEAAARRWAEANGPGRKYWIARVGPDEHGAGQIIA